MPGKRFVDRTVTAVNEFIVLPLQVSRSSSKPTTHFLYLRPNAPKIPTEDTPRELFAVNIPVDATDSHLRSLFADSLGGGRIESVAYEGHRVRKGISGPVAPIKNKKRKRNAEIPSSAQAQDVGALPEIWDRGLHASGSSAIITMIDKASADLAIKQAKKTVKSGHEIPWTAGATSSLPALGSLRYLTHHELRHPDLAELQQSVDTFMEAFTAHETSRAKLLARQRSVPDEDGFITVTRGGRNGPARVEEDAPAKQKEKKRVMDDFYRFQTREKKKEVAKDLVRAFEEDARKVEEMRKKRNKFRPE